jgi:hypothetical protein
MVRHFKGWNTALEDEISQAEALMESRYCAFFSDADVGLSYKESYLNGNLIGIDYYINDLSEFNSVVDFHKSRHSMLKFDIALPPIIAGRVEVQMFFEYNQNGGLERKVKSITNNEKKYIKQIVYNNKDERQNSTVYLMNTDGSINHIFEYEKNRNCVDAYSFVNQESINPNQLLLDGHLKKYYCDEFDD